MGALVKAIIRSSPARKLGFAGFALLCLTILLNGTGQLRAQEGAVVLLEPQTLALDQGQTSSVVVRIEDAANLYGVQLALSFDPEKIKVIDGDTAVPGVQIRAGDFLALDEGFIAANEANNQTGQLTYALSLLYPAEPVAGAGTLVEFEVEALQTGSSDLLLDSVILASPEGAQLPVRLSDIPANDGGIIVPSAAATEPAAASVPTTEDSLLTVTPAAGNTPAPPPTAQSAASPTRVVASPAAGDMQVPAATVTTALAAVNEPATGTAPGQTAAAETDPALVKPGRAAPAETVPAAEIAEAPLPLEKDNSIQSEEGPSPALTVIGRSPNLDENQAPPATAAPASNSQDSIERPYLAIGLTLLVVALIALWFLKRLLWQR